MVDDLKEKVLRRLQLKHRPEQISLRLKSEGTEVSHESIYRVIAEDKRWGGGLYKNLRINGKRSYCHGIKGSRTKLPERVYVQEHPDVVDKRLRYGDWEADLIEGSKGVGFVLNVYERKSRFGKLFKIGSKSSDGTADALIAQMTGYKVKTITYDNGLEFSCHRNVTQVLGGQSYFCRPCHSWKKGGVETFNGLVGQSFLPEGTSFADLINKKLKEIEQELNKRPKKNPGHQIRLLN